MINRNTPETNREKVETIYADGMMCDFVVDAKFAEKLEEERNAARDLAAKFLRALQNVGSNLSNEQLPWE